jgi:hypothetical protein
MASDSEYPLDKSLLQAVELPAVENEIQVKGMDVESQRSTPIDCIDDANKIM